MNQIYARLLAVLLLVFFCGQQSQAQDVELEITGKVIAAEDGMGLPGVVVINVTTKTGGSTNIDGMYKVKASAGNVLEYRFLGYTTETRTVGSLVTIDVTMREETKVLKEAIVVGYGTQNKKDVTGAIATIGAKDFQTGVIPSPEGLIQGKVAGVQITNNGGAPGGGATIRIRGTSSLNASNDPLYVVDGVPLSKDGISGSPNALSLINPADIETFTVLKDASATAIYGSRAANGVILITTKKGAKGMKPTMNFTTQNSVSFIARKVEVLDGDQFRAIVKADGTPAQRKLLGNYNTDWQKVIYQPALSSDNNLSYTGSSANIPFRISGGFFEQQGILRTDKMQRQSIGISISPSFLDKALKTTINLRTSRSSNRFANTGAIGSAISFDPTQPIYSGNRRELSPRYGGYYEWLTSAGKPLDVAGRNPLGQLLMMNNTSEVYRTIGNITLDYSPAFLPGFSANLNLGMDFSTGQGGNLISDSAAMSYYDFGSRTKYKQENQNQIGEFYLKYSKNLPSLLSRFDLLAGTAFQDFTTKNYNYRSKTFRGDTLAKNAEPNFLYDIPQNRIQSFYARASYTFMEKIHLQGSIREDGSSRFSESNRWGLFPSAALSYELTKESFLRSQKVLSNLKFRLSYGVTGQQDIGFNYSYLPYYSKSNGTAQYPIGGQYFNMYRPDAYDPNRRWETTTTYNAGLDYGFIEERITGSIDVYQRNTTDLLNLVPLPSGSNYSDQLLTNVGSVTNKGIELGINIEAIKSEDISLNFNFNTTFNKSEVTKLVANSDTGFNGVVSGEGIGLDRRIQRLNIGLPINSFYILEQVYGKDGKPVEGEYIDQNGDGKINEKDFVYKHQPAPKVFYGFSTQFTYKNLTIGTVIRASYGNYVFNNVQAGQGSLNSILIRDNSLSNASANVLETNFSGNLATGNNTNRFYSSYYLRDASFIRMDNINLSYNFGEVSENWFLAITGNVQNPFVITKYKGIDPEIASGVDNNFYPRPRTFVVGLSLTH